MFWILLFSLLVNLFILSFVLRFKAYYSEIKILLIRLILGFTLIWIFTNILFFLVEQSNLYFVAILSYWGAFFAISSIMLLFLLWNKDSYIRVSKVYIIGVYIVSFIFMFALSINKNLLIGISFDDNGNWFLETTNYLSIFGGGLLIMYIIGLLLSIQIYRKEKSSFIKNIIVSNIIVFIISFVTNFIFPTLGIYRYTGVVPLSSLIFISFLYFNIFRFGAFSIIDIIKKSLFYLFVGILFRSVYYIFESNLVVNSYDLFLDIGNLIGVIIIFALIFYDFIVKKAFEYGSLISFNSESNAFYEKKFESYKINVRGILEPTQILESYKKTILEIPHIQFVDIVSLNTEYDIEHVDIQSNVDIAKVKSFCNSYSGSSDRGTSFFHIVHQDSDKYRFIENFVANAENILPQIVFIIRDSNDFIFYIGIYSKEVRPSFYIRK